MDHLHHSEKLCLDPVCGMSVVPEKAKGTSNWKNIDYFFCSTNCKMKFDAAPATYIKNSEKKEAPPKDEEKKIEYTCPMHPQIRQWGPGSCPICGMSLEPVTVSLDQEQDDHEFKNMLQKFWVSAALSIPLLVISMGGRHLISSARFHEWANYIELVLATPVVLWGAWPFFTRFWQSLVSKSPNMFTLIGLGVGVAYLFSVVAVFFPNLFPDSFRSPETGEVGLYFEAASIIVTLVLLGQVMELKARSQTSSAIKALLGLAPKTAHLILADGSEKEVGIESVKVGDHLKVRPGEKIPIDGTVITGQSSVDESMVSGEAIPLEKEKNSAVIGSTINGTGSLLIEAKKIGKDTLLSQIVQMVSEAQRSRAPIQKLVDQVASYFVPAVIVISILTAVVWGIWGPEPRLSYAIVNAIAVLIIACPCALGLATPMSIMVSTGRAASMGVLFRNAESIEQMRKVNVLLVDKTGTLTEGKPKLITVKSLTDTNADELLVLAASLESESEHPLATAIVNGAKAKKLKLLSLEGFQSVTGKGAFAKINNAKISVGNRELMIDLGIQIDAVTTPVEALRADGQTVMFVAKESQLLGYLGVADPIKNSTLEAVQAIKKLGLQIVMLTGDHETTARAVAKKIGIDEVIAGVKPQNKVEAVVRFQAQGKIVAMAGDGINDAPALAKAHVGIAMGTGTDVAMKSAGVTLVKGDLRGIIKARELSLATIANIRQNLFFAFIYNALGVPVAAGVLFPFTGELLSPMYAALAMSLSSASVIVNSLRLRSAAK